MRRAALPLVLVAACMLRAEDEKPGDEPVVYFDEDPAIVDGLKRVDALIEKGDAKGAAIWLRKLLLDRGAKVAQALDGSFLPAWRVLSRRAEALPKEASASWEALYGSESRTRVAAALIQGDLDAIEAAAHAGFPSLSDDELLRVAARLAAGGRRLGAESLLEERALERPASISAAPSALLASLYGGRGEGGAIRALRAALPACVLASVSSIGGEELSAGEVLDRATAAARGPVAPISVLPGGGTAPQPPLREPAEAPSWTRAVPVLGEAFDSLVLGLDNWSSGVQVHPDMPAARAILPLASAVARDLLLVHLGKSLFAYRLSDGSLAWTRGGERNLGDFLVARTGAGLFRRYAVVADDERAYATMAGRWGEHGERSDLVCLSLADGRLLWRLDEGNDGKDLSFTGVPHLDGDRLYVGAIGTEKKEEVRVLSLEAATGKVVWSAPAASHTPPPDEVWEYSPEPVPLVTAHRGLVIACTGTGGIVALDPATGAFLWGLKYPCQPVEANSYPDIAQEHCWLLPVNPMLPSAEGLWVAPSDAPRFYLVDAALRSIRLSHRKDCAERYRFLVGTTEGGLLLGGPEVGLYSPCGGLLHHWQLPGREGGGRPAMAGGLVLVPRARRVVAIDARTFAEAWSRPVEGGAGDVLVSGAGVAVVSPRRVTFFPWK